MSESELAKRERLEREAEFNRQLRQELEERLTIDFKKVCESPRGRRVMFAIMEFSGVYRANEAKDNQVFYNEGKRKVGLWVLAQLQKVDLLLPHRIAEENYSEGISNDQKRQKIREG